MSASSSGRTATAGPPTTARASKPSSKKDQLYEKCLEKPLGHVFTMEALHGYGVVDSLEEVLGIADQLVSAHLFVMMKTVENEAMWKLRAREQANLIRGFTPNERLVYSRIEESDTNGIWQRAVAVRTGLHATIITKILKDLKSKHLVKEIKSAKFPTKKMLMLYDLEPSEENTGGAFFTDGELDVGLVEVLCGVVTDWVEKQSWAEAPKPVSHTPYPHGHHAQKKRKREDGTPALTVIDKPGEQPKYRQPLSKNRHHIVPQPSSYDQYPNSAAILEMIRACEFLTPSVKLRFTDKDVALLLDMLVFDKRLERMADDRYRSVRRSFEDIWNGRWHESEEQREAGVGNGVSDAPCGKCPLFHLCEEGGVVSPESCGYFDEWLDF